MLSIFIPHLVRLSTLFHANGQVAPAGAQFDAIVREQMAHQGWVGASVGILRDGKVILAKGYGQKQLDNPDPVAVDTPFAVGSVTKQFTAACLLKLADDGKLSVDDRLSTYMPQLTSGRSVRLRDLLNHVAGYPDYFPLDFVDRRMFTGISTLDLANRYGRLALDFAPGTQWSYSNTNFIILSAVIEKVSGQSFGTFLKRRILDPLGMQDTIYAPKKRDVRFAQGVTSMFLGPKESAVREGYGWCGAAGDLHSTARDMLRWDLALIEGKVLSPKSFAIFSHSRVLRNGVDTGYGCGIFVSTRNGYRIYHHDGEVSGFTATNFICSANRSAFVVLINQDDASVEGLKEALASRVVPTKHGPVPTSVPAPIPVRTLPIMTGPNDVEAASKLLTELQSGKLDRSRLAAEFNFFMSPERVKKASESLGPLGAPSSAMLTFRGERGGLVVAVMHFQFRTRSAEGLLYRNPRGQIEEFFVLPG